MTVPWNLIYFIIIMMINKMLEIIIEIVNRNYVTSCWYNSVPRCKMTINLGDKLTLPNFTGVDSIPPFIEINGLINTRFVETNVSVHGKLISLPKTLIWTNLYLPSPQVWCIMINSMQCDIIEQWTAICEIMWVNSLPAIAVHPHTLIYSSPTDR